MRWWKVTALILPIVASVSLFTSCSSKSSDPPVNKAPDSPVLIEPADGAMDMVTMVNLSWTGEDPDGDMVAFDVYAGMDNPPMSLIESNYSESQLTLSELSQSETYYWRVVARDNFGLAGPSSETRRFTIGEFNGGWLSMIAMPTARLGPASAVVGGKFYVIGGLAAGGAIPDLNVNEAYDPITDSWTALAPMPTRRSYCEAVEHNGKIYVLGGSFDNLPLSTVECYDPLTNSWTPVQQMPDARTRFSAALFNNKIYVFGGFEGNAHIIALDLTLNQWQPIADLPKPLFGESVTLFNNHFYLIGGSDPDEFWKNDVTVFDPSTLTFSSRSEMPTARHSHRASLINGKIYVTGGLNAEITHIFFASVEVYDVATDKWLTRSKMLHPRHDHGAGVIGNFLYVAGGLTNTFPDILRSIEQYDPSSDP